MLEPTHHRLPLRRQPGSLALLALLLSAAAALCLTPYELRRHHVTADGEIEVLHVFEGKALFQYRFPAGDGTRNYQLDLAQVRRGEEPEEANAIGDVLECDLIKEIDQACWLELKTGRKLLLTGYPPPEKPSQSFAELIKYTESREALYWLIDDKNVVKARTLEELAKAVPELTPALGSVKLLKAPEFFDHLPKEADKADLEKSTHTQG